MILTTDKLKNQLKAVFFILLFSSIGNLLFGATYYSWPASGNDPANLNHWWVNNNGTGAHPVAFNGNTFIIQDGHTMTATATWAAGTATIQFAGATSVLDMATFQLTMGAGGVITMSNAAAICKTSSTHASVPIPTGKTWAGIVEYTRLAGGQAIPAGTYAHLKLLNTSNTNTSQADFTATTLTTTAGGTLDMVATTLTATTINHAGVLKTQETANPCLPTGKTWGGTVEYNKTNGGQTVMAGTYATLTLSNTSGTNTASGAVATTTFNTTAGGTIDMVTYALTGTTISHAGILKTQCTSNPCLPTGKTWGGTVQYNRTAGGQSVSDGTYATLTFLNTSGTQTALGAIVANTAFTTTAGGTLDMVTYALSGTLTTLNHDGTLKTQNLSATPIPTGKDWSNGTITYNAAAGGQTVMAGTYYSLTLGNTSGTSTASGAIVVNSGTLTTTATGIFDMSTFQLTGTVATITNNGTIKTACIHATLPVFSGKTWGGTGTLEFTVLTGGQYIPAGTYNGTLKLDNTSGTVTALGNIAENSALTFTTTAGGTIDMVTYTLDAATISHAGYLKTQSSSAIAIPVNKTWGGTVEYNRAGSQTIAYGTFGHLIISGGSNAVKTLKDGDATVTGNFTVAASTGFADGATVGGDNIMTVNGNVIMNGTHTSSVTSNTGGSITLSGGGAAHDISGSGSFWNLIMNDAQGATLSASITINGTLTLTSGKITIGANSITLSSASGISGGSSSSYLITNGAGMLKRAIDVGQGTYNFPVGSATAYNGASIFFSGSPGVTRLDGKYTASTVSAGSGLPLASSSCLTVNALLDNGYWTFAEGAGTLSSTFDLTFTRNGQTNASTELQDHAIVRRNSSATAWTDPGSWAVSTDATTTAAGQISPIIHTGISSVGEFAIAKGTHSAPVVAAIGGGVTVACVNTASGTAFTDATAGGVWSITSGTGSATIGSATGVITGTAQGTVTVNYSVTTGGDCTTTVTNTGTTVYTGGTIAPASTAICSGSTTTISVAGSTGTKQWQDNVNSGGWVNGTGTNPTATTYTTPTLTYPNSYQFRMRTQGACPSLNTITLTPLQNGAAAPGVPTNYTLNYPSLSLAKYKGSCSDDYTFTQSLRNANANIAIGQTVTVTFMAGTDATTFTGGTFNGTAIAMGTSSTTATTVTFVTPVAVSFACPASNFTIVLNGITNPGYNVSGNATVSIANNTTGGLDTGTYPYAMATQIGGYHEFDMNTTWNYAVQNALGHCYTNLAAGTYCFEYTNPAAGAVKIGTILDEGSSSGCSIGNAGWAKVSDASSGCASGGGISGQVLYENSCTASGTNAKAGSCVTAGVNYTTCFTIPVGCDGVNFCPLIDCSGTCGAGALPIELLYFDAKLNGGVVELSWATSTETNNDYFTVEKTIDGSVYFDFLKVKGAGTSTSVLHYNTVDDKPFEGLSYYRLMQTDYDGKYAYSRLVPVNMDPFARLTVKYVFTDSDYNTLQYQISSANSNPISVKVLDMLGKTIITKNIAFYPDGQTLSLDASSLSKGVYLLRVSDGEHVAVKKFVY